MNSFLIYVLKSTVCISLLYLAFRMLLSKETFFRLNRMLLLTVVIGSMIIPLMYLPQFMQSEVKVQFAPLFTIHDAVSQEIPDAVGTVNETIISPVVKTEPKIVFSIPQLLLRIYFAGIFISLLILLRGITSVLSLFRKGEIKRINGYRILIIDQDIPAFSFGHFIIISQCDFDAHRSTILAHEQAHIRMNHFYDLVLMEAAKIFHWFNPTIYWLISDLKEIHEFQADDHTLNKGIDATKYQLLIIQKGVGSQRFALANSFNHCQIKKRITMMNKQKSKKAWQWKAAAFLPMLALLLMAFGRTGENEPSEKGLLSQITEGLPQDSVRQWSEADFGRADLSKSELKSYFVNVIKIDAKSNLSIGRDKNVSSLKVIAGYIRECMDYSLADEKTKQEFSKMIINGQERRGPIKRINIQSDPSTPREDYQNLLNTIGNTILEIRGKYANEIFKISYQKLTDSQRNEIDKLIPTTTVFMQTPLLASENQNNAQKEDEGVQKSEKVMNANDQTKKPVFVVVDEMAEFPGGDQGLRRFIAENVKYPVEAQKNKIQGRVFVNFVVNSNGKVDRAKIVRGVDPLLDAEAIKVVNLLPDWTPGKQHGVAVDVSYTVPIQFSLESKDNVAAEIKKPVFLVVDEMPQFPGGDLALRKFISEKVKYPAEAQKDKAQGEVVVNFVFRSDGKVENAKIIRGIHPALDAEAIRVVSTLPDWKPGKQEGKPVNVAYSIPVRFTLE